ncbi:DUF551 domain-containing protein [Pluralibacter gergoviae]|uniref:DUF551 domain-containing protein n=1 Tax=Pluralibacter gergoviae TaxID=61647 RepID=UPI003EE0BC46
MEWIKCSERMPPHGESVIFSSSGKVLAGYYNDGRYLKKPVGKWYWIGRVYKNPVTHWMPMPPPPTK